MLVQDPGDYEIVCTAMINDKMFARSKTTVFSRKICMAKAGTGIMQQCVHRVP